jgi:hypothetical protein
VIQRQTQDAAYWRDYVVRQDDIDLITSKLLDEVKPMRASDFARMLIAQHVERDNAELRRHLNGNGLIYAPKNAYAVGDALSFPILGFLTGVVNAVRTGAQIDGATFDAIDVSLSDGTRREFAARLEQTHALNDLDPSTLVKTEDLKSPEELVALHSPLIAEKVDAALAKNGDLIKIGDEWFLRAMMADVNVGHLNLAEAVLDIAGGKPMSTDMILRDLGLPEDVAANVQEASLNSALASDERFDEVSLTGRPAWILRRNEPTEVHDRPQELNPARFGSAVTLGPELEALAAQIADEVDFDPATQTENTTSAETVLTFSHRRAGTLGWTHKLASVLPKNAKPRTLLTFRDRMSGKEYFVWLVRNGSYIWGLSEFYRAAELPAGAEIVLSATERPHEFVLDAKRRKPKREWVRVATVVNNHLRLETAQRAVACEFDDLMSVFVDDVRAIDGLRAGADIAGAVHTAFLEIAKLSPQGNVHARTLYAVVNTLLRAGARDVFAALVASGQFAPLGDNYWHLADRG